MPNSVRFYDSTMSGSPALSGTAGALIGVLDGCLVDGFGSVTVNSLVVASNVATATVSAGHQFVMIGTTGPVIRIAGASPAGLNGDWRISVTSATTFTFTTTGISDQSATGTIAAKRAPAGFSKAFTGTNKAVYRSDIIVGSRLYCRIDDNYTTYSRIRGYETMSDVDTGTGPFPTDAQLSGGGYVYKATASNRAWSLFSDGRILYFFCDAAGGNSFQGGFVFGDIDSYVAGDAFGCNLICINSSSGTLSLYALSNSNYSYLARPYTQVGGSINSARYSHGKSSGLGAGGQLYPSGADNNIHLWPVECWDGSTLARGMMPGVWNPIHNATIQHGLIIEAIPSFPGRTLLIQVTGSASYQCAMDITGPWR